MHIDPAPPGRSAAGPHVDAQPRVDRQAVVAGAEGVRRHRLVDVRLAVRPHRREQLGEAEAPGVVAQRGQHDAREPGALECRLDADLRGRDGVRGHAQIRSAGHCGGRSPSRRPAGRRRAAGRHAERLGHDPTGRVEGDEDVVEEVLLEAEVEGVANRVVKHELRPGRLHVPEDVPRLRPLGQRDDLEVHATHRPRGSNRFQSRSATRRAATCRISHAVAKGGA